MSVSKTDKMILRELGLRYMEIATMPIQKEKINLWKSLNRCKMQRPLVVIEQLPWHELNVNDELTCRIEDTFLRIIENDIRQAIYKWNHFPVDMVVDPFISIPKAISNSGYGISISEKTLKTDETNDVFSHHYENQIKDFDDIEKIKDMKITHDSELSKFRAEEAAVIFHGIAPIKSCGIQFHLGVWDFLSMCMGVENIYYDLLDRPDFLHAVMDRITSSAIAGIEKANELMIYNEVE